MALGYAVRHPHQLHPVSGCAWGVNGRGAWLAGRVAGLRGCAAGSQKASYLCQPAAEGMGQPHSCSRGTMLQHT